MSATSVPTSVVNLPSSAMVLPDETGTGATPLSTMSQADKLAAGSSKTSEIFGQLQQALDKDPTLSAAISSDFHKILKELNSSHTLSAAQWQALLANNPVVAQNSMQNLYDGLAKLLLLCHDKSLCSPKLVNSIVETCQRLEEFGVKHNSRLELLLPQIQDEARSFMAQFNNPAVRQHVSKKEQNTALQEPNTRPHKTHHHSSYKPSIKDLPPFTAERLAEIDEFTGKLAILYLEHPHTAVKTANCFIGELHTRLTAEDRPEFSNDFIEKIENIGKKLSRITSKAVTIFDDTRAYKSEIIRKKIEATTQRGDVDLGNMFGLHICLENPAQSLSEKVSDLVKKHGVKSTEELWDKERQRVIDWAKKGLDRQHGELLHCLFPQSVDTEEQLSPYQAALQQTPHMINEVATAIKNSVKASILEDGDRQKYLNIIDRLKSHLTQTNMQQLGEALLRHQHFASMGGQPAPSLAGITLDGIASEFQQLFNIAKQCQLVIPAPLAEKALQVFDILAANNVDISADFTAHLESFLTPQESVIKDFHAIPDCAKVIKYVGSMKQKRDIFFSNISDSYHLPLDSDAEENEIITGFSQERLDNITAFCKQLGQLVLENPKKALEDCQAFAGELYLMVQKSGPNEIPQSAFNAIKMAAKQLSFVYSGATKINKRLAKYEKDTGAALLENFIQPLNPFAQEKQPFDKLPAIIKILEKAEEVFSYPTVNQDDRHNIVTTITNLLGAINYGAYRLKTADLDKSTADNLQKFISLATPFLKLNETEAMQASIKQNLANIEKLIGLEITMENIQATATTPKTVTEFGISPEFFKKFDFQLPVISGWENFCRALKNLFATIFGHGGLTISQEIIEDRAYRFSMKYKREIAFLYQNYDNDEAAIRQLLQEAFAETNPDLSPDNFGQYIDIILQRFGAAKNIYRQDLFSERPLLATDNFPVQIFDMSINQFVTFFLNNESQEIQDAIRNLPPEQIFALKDHYIHLLLKELPNDWRSTEANNFFGPITGDSYALESGNQITTTALQHIHNDLVALAQATINSTATAAPQPPEDIKNAADGAAFIIAELYRGIPDIQHFYSGLLKNIYALSLHHSQTLPDNDEQFLQALRALPSETLAAILHNCQTIRVVDILSSKFSDDIFINDPQYLSFSFTQWRLCGMKRELEHIRRHLTEVAAEKNIDLSALSNAESSSIHVNMEYARFFDSEEEISELMISGKQPMPFSNHDRIIFRIMNQSPSAPFNHLE